MVRKKLTAALALGLITTTLQTQALAATPQTGVFATSPTVNPAHLNLSAGNPAALGHFVKPSRHGQTGIRTGLLSNTGAYLTLGDLDNMDLVIEHLVDDMEAVDQLNFEYLRERYPGLESGDESSSELEAIYLEALADRVNGSILGTLEEGLKVDAGADFEMPLSPLIIHSDRLQGTLALGIATSAQTNIRFIGDSFGVSTRFFNDDTSDLGAINLDLNQAAGAYSSIEPLLSDDSLSNEELILAVEQALQDNQLLEGNQQTIDYLKALYGVDGAAAAGGDGGMSDLQAQSQLITDSGLDNRAALATTFSLGYGVDLTPFTRHRLDGELSAGARINMNHVTTSRQFISLQQEMHEDSDALDNLDSNLTKNTREQWVVTLDAGMFWQGRNAQAGVTGYHLNSPEVAYPDLAQTLDPTALSALEGLANKGKSQVDDRVELSAHAIIEGGLHTQGRQFYLQGYHTLGESVNWVGTATQKTGLVAGFNSNRWYLPGLRVGVDHDRLDGGLTTVKAGATLFERINIDAAMALDEIEVDGSTYPRHLSLAIGVQQAF